MVPVTADDNIIVLSDIDAFKEYLVSGNVSVKVSYDETDIYLSSNGIDTDGNEFKNISVTSQSVNLTVASNVTNTTLGQHVNITGNLTDADNNPIKNTDVYLNITGIEGLVKVTTGDNGEFSYDYIAGSVGTVTVNATFNDNTGYYYNASAKTSLRVDKIPTI